MVLLQDGVIGSYTSRDRTPGDALDAVMALIDEPDSEIAVTGGQAGATLSLMIL